MRGAELARRTAETDIRLSLDLDGAGRSEIDTGCGFLDHMLTLFARHGRFDLNISCKGDTYVDGHHTVEDVGIVLGQAFREALGDKKGIRRYGTGLVPMDEALCRTVLDCSNRPYLAFDAPMPQPIIGGYDSCLTVEFMRAFSVNGGITLHQKCEYGDNAHHITEALFKSLGVALKEAVRVEGDAVVSTKGAL